MQTKPLRGNGHVDALLKSVRTIGSGAGTIFLCESIHAHVHAFSILRNDETLGTKGRVARIDLRVFVYR